MKKLLSALPVYFYMLLFLSSCDIFCDCEDDITEPCLFSYDSVAYTPNGTGQDQIISPSFENTKPEGIFSATPAGLAIDSLTGNVNLNTSQPKTEYTIVFTLRDGNTTCETKIYIGEPKMQVCDLQYPDNFYIPNATENIFVKPKAPFDDTTKFDGTFSVYPHGLDIDPATGIFNVDISEAGLTYTITYTSKDGNTTCQTKVTIAGIDYPDTLIDVSQERAVVAPIITSTPDQQPPVEINFNPEQEAVQQGLVIQRDGVIDVRNTLQNLDSIAGGILPSGYKREFEISYEYLQGNAFVSNTIDIIIYWYASEDEVPEDLLEILGRKTPSSKGGKLMHRHPILVAAGKYK